MATIWCLPCPFSKNTDFSIKALKPNNFGKIKKIFCISCSIFIGLFNGPSFVFIMSMAQSHHFKKWGRDISLTSGKAASRGNKNSLWVMKGTIIFPHERRSRSSEKKFPHERRSREWGNFFLLRLLCLNGEI